MSLIVSYRPCLFILLQSDLGASIVMNYPSPLFTAYTSRQVSLDIHSYPCSTDESGDEIGSESQPLLQTFTMVSGSSGGDALGLMSGSSSISSSATNTTLSTPSVGPTRDVSEQGTTVNIQEYSTEEHTPRIGMEDIDALTNSLNQLFHLSVESIKSQGNDGLPGKRSSRDSSISRMKKTGSGDGRTSLEFGARKSRWERMDTFLPGSKQVRRRGHSSYHSRETRRRRPKIVIPGKEDGDRRSAQLLLLDGDTPTEKLVSQGYFIGPSPSMPSANDIPVMVAPQTYGKQNTSLQAQDVGSEASPTIPVLRMHQPSAPSSPILESTSPSSDLQTPLSPDRPMLLPKAPMIRPSVPQMERSPSPLSLPSPQLLIPNPSPLPTTSSSSHLLD
jgi:hypothetical protein